MNRLYRRFSNVRLVGLLWTGNVRPGTQAFLLVFLRSDDK